MVQLPDLVCTLGAVTWRASRVAACAKGAPSCCAASSCPPPCGSASACRPVQAELSIVHKLNTVPGCLQAAAVGLPRGRAFRNAHQQLRRWLMSSENSDARNE